MATTYCPRCGARFDPPEPCGACEATLEKVRANPKTAHFCMTCGAKYRAGATCSCGTPYLAPRPPEPDASASGVKKPLDICGRCGFARLAADDACSHCGAPRDAARTVERDSLRYWAAVECRFTCRMCGFAVPLSAIDGGGAVACARCGLEQALDVGALTQGLEHARTVADLFGTSARVDPSLRVAGPNALSVTARAGHPPCEACAAPLEIALDPETRRATTTCSSCQATAAYELSERARDAMPALVAAVAPDHRADQPAVHVAQPQGQAVAVTCPGCSAPLGLPTGEDRLVTCAFCHVVARIPERAWFRVSGKEPKSTILWLLFRGESLGRLEGVAATDAGEPVVLREAPDAVRARLERERLTRENAEARQRREVEEAEEAERPRAPELSTRVEAPRVAKRSASPVVLAGIVAVLILTGAALFMALR